LFDSQKKPFLRSPFSVNLEPYLGEPLTEQELIQKILSGDEAAFQELYESHKRRLEQTAIHFLGRENPFLQDVVQDTFLAALPQLKDFRFECTLYTWLNRFTVNFCFQVLNKGKKSVLAETEQLEQWARPRQAQPNAQWEGVLKDEIANLTPEHREVIQKKDIEGYSYADIAHQLKVAPGTVMSRLSRARKELRLRLEKKKDLFNAVWKD
jgi:RNA polymerase sigma-70 factor, ECF subfamily